MNMYPERYAKEHWTMPENPPVGFGFVRREGAGSALRLDWPAKHTIIAASTSAVARRKITHRRTFVRKPCWKLNSRGGSLTTEKLTNH